MTLDDLHRTLSKALATGKIGTPVALRMNWQTAGSQNDLAAMGVRLAGLARTVFDAEASSLAARQAANGGQLHLLLDYSAGQTLFLTLGGGAVKASELHLLLIGNHGVIRLEGAELCDVDGPESQIDVQRWHASIDRSLKSGQSVPVSQS